MNGEGTTRPYPGTVAGFGAIGLWSLTVAIGRSLAEQLGPLTAAASVYVVAGGLALAGLAVRPGVCRELCALPRRYLLGCGALFVSYMVALYLSIGLVASRQQAIDVSMLNYLWPALTLLLAVPLLKQRASSGLFLGSLLAVGGAVFCLMPSGRLDPAWLVARVAANPLPYVCGLVAAITWALYSNLTRRWAGAAPRGGIALFLPASGLVLLLLAVVLPEAGTWSWRAAAEVLALAVATTAGYGLWDYAMRRGDFVLVAAGSYFTPLLSALVASFYLGVLPGIHLWLGCLFLIAGSLLSWHSVRQTVPIEPDPGLRRQGAR